MPRASSETAGDPPGAPPYRPLVFAHRGSSAAVAEHTLAAYLRAIDEGADGLECDVRLTRDGHLICMHDRRVERTSNGRGVVSEFALDELSTLDFGSWHPGYPESADQLVNDRPEPAAEPIIDEARNRVLTFAKLLEVVVDSPRPVRLLVETKHPTRYGGLVERTLVSELRRYGLADPATDIADAPVTVMSFSSLAVRRVRELAPGVPTVMLFRSVPRLFRDGSLPFRARIAGPGMLIVREYPEYVGRLHAAGNLAYSWTVNRPEDIELVLDLRVDGIITDRPTEVLAALARRAGA